MIFRKNSNYTKWYVLDVFSICYDYIIVQVREHKKTGKKQFKKTRLRNVCGIYDQVKNPLTVAKIEDAMMLNELLK